MTEEEEGRCFAKLAKEATRTAFERHRAANHGPAVTVGNQIRRIWADGTYDIIGTVEPRIKVKKGLVIKL